MDKIVLFGLGNRYSEYKDIIFSKYDVIACTSNNPEENNKIDNYMNIEKIPFLDFDFVLICCDSDVEIFNQLLKMGIDAARIKLYREVLDVGGIFQSEALEDLTIMLLLELMGKSDQPYYLDLGANHPIVGSNTYGLYLMGASGLLVEANPELKDIIGQIRPRDLLINKALCEDGKPVKFYRLRQLGLGTLVYDEADKDTVSAYNNWDLLNSYEVDGIRIQEVIALLEREPDLMSIDLEGMDWTILHQIDFKTFRPAIVIAETRPWGYHEHSAAEFNKFFEENNYLLFRETPGNGIFFDAKYRKIVGKYYRKDLKL